MLGGIALAWWVIRSIGLGDVAAAARRIGWGGFAGFCLYSLGVYALLGGAWLAATAGEPGSRLPLFAWARMVREAVSDLLPLSQIGGFVAGGRVLRAGGVATPRVYASMVADQTQEMASQLVFTLFGLAATASLLAGEGGAAVRPAIFGGVAALLGLVLLFLLGHRRFLALAVRLAHRLLPRAAGAIERVECELARIYAARRAMAACFLLNLAGWIASAAGAWVVLLLIGHRLPIWWVVSIEAMIFAVRSVAFAVPGAIGFQEAAYALLGPLFGLPPGAALALSLAKRARDIVLSLPTLIAWQATEAHTAWRGRRG